MTVLDFCNVWGLVSTDELLVYYYYKDKPVSFYELYRKLKDNIINNINIRIEHKDFSSDEIYLDISEYSTWDELSVNQDELINKLKLRAPAGTLHTVLNIYIK